MKSKIKLTLVLLLFGFATSTQAFGQKNESANGPVGIFSTGAEYDEFMGNAKQLAYGPNGDPELRAMIPMLNDIALNRPLGWTNQRYGGQGGELDLLSNEKVRSELEMVDEQYEDLQRMNESVQKRVAEQIRGLDFSDRENLTAQIKRIRDEANKDLNSVLLPHQLERLQQLRSQTLLRNRSIVDVITSEPLKTDLKITDEQTTELKETEKEIEEELEREIAKLRKESREKLLGKLKRSQREEVKELFGETFDFGKRKRTPNKQRQKK
ncbi:MAG: hypothetical protein GY819_15610 [Planctomycetaceae bacterium]|nr:hypothetical protein [Planctomycetaceae bacterium]MCP4464218.1 hypothetical protein [Planctomycetaceae bacterium]